MDAENVRAALYVRQSDSVEEGIDQQKDALKDKAKREGWRVVKVYSDNNTSASKTRGAGTDWAQMLVDIDAGKINLVLAVTAARLLRRRVDVIELAKPKRNVRVVTTRDGIDTSTMGGRIMLDVLTGMAEEEISEKEARAIPYRAKRRAAGHPPSGLVPFGYSWVQADRKDPGWRNRTRYVIVPEEAEVILYMSSELLSGVKLGAIVSAMNGKGWTTREGARWRTSTARRILISPYHAAMLPPAMPEGVHYRADRFTWSECTPGAWEPILSADAVNAARKLLLLDARRSHDGDTRPKWLLSTIGRCGRCHGPLRSAKTKTTATSYRAYRCTAGCFVRPAELIEEYVSAAAIDVLSAPGLLSWADDSGVDVEALRGRQEALAALRAEWFQSARAGKLTPAEWDEMSAEWDAELVQLDAELADAVRVNPLAAFVTGDDVRGLWEGMSVGRRRAVLGALVEHVEVSPVGKGRRVRTVEEVEATVSMGWRRVEHRRSFETGKTTRTPRVPVEAQEAIARALNV
jgi:DNA invertase Pin-like site-specific DNA recombinase